MDVREAYDEWAEQYDIDKNKTRDMEGDALQEMLRNYLFVNCLEIGCGTGKNTSRLLESADKVTAVDFSKILKKAEEKFSGRNVWFIQADVMKEWTFVDGKYDLITFNLILEHIEDLQPILRKAPDVLTSKGILYIGELHPFKQYSGSSARFESKEGSRLLKCYNHHISDYTGAAKAAGFELMNLAEYFDGKHSSEIPRILCLLYRK